MCVCVCVCEKDLALNNLQGLKFHKTQQTNQSGLGWTTGLGQGKNSKFKTSGILFGTICGTLMHYSFVVTLYKNFGLLYSGL